MVKLLLEVATFEIMILGMQYFVNNIGPPWLSYSSLILLKNNSR